MVMQKVFSIVQAELNMDRSNTETDTEKQPGDKDLGLDSRDNPSSSHTYAKIQAL
jgi:acyl carrier protein